MSISKHTTYNIAGAVLPLGVTLLTVPLYLQIVGVERYGLLTICWVVLGYLGFLDLGLGPAVSQKIASIKAEQSAAAETVFWTAVWLSVAAGILTAVLVYASAGIYFAFGGLESAHEEEIRAAVPLLAMVLPVAMVSSVAAGALHGRQRFLALNLISMTSSTLMSLLPLLVAYLWSPTLSGLIVGAIAARFAGLVLQYWNCVRAVPLRGLGLPKKDLVGSLLKFGGWVTVSTAVAPLLVTVDRLAIGAVLGAAAVAAYSIPFSLIARMSIIPGSLSSALYPRFAATTDAEQKRLMTLALAAILVTMTPICIIVIAAVRPFFDFWLGPELAATSAPVATFLILGAWANGIAYVPLAMLQGSGRPDVVAKIHLIELLPYWILLGAFLFLFGLAGAAVAWSLRALADSLLLHWRSGSDTGSLAIARWPFLLLLVSIAGAGLEEPLKWLIIGGSFSVACVWSSYHLPDAMRTRLGVLGRMLPRAALPDAPQVER